MEERIIYFAPLWVPILILITVIGKLAHVHTVSPCLMGCIVSSCGLMWAISSIALFVTFFTSILLYKENRKIKNYILSSLFAIYSIGFFAFGLYFGPI